MTRSTNDITLFSTVVRSTKGKLHWALHSSGSRMTCPEVLCLRNCPLKDLLNTCVLMYDDFQLMYSQTLGVSYQRAPSFLLTPFNIKTAGSNWPASLQHAIIVTLGFDVKTRTFWNPFSINKESCLLHTCMPLSSMLKMFPAVLEGCRLLLFSLH